MTLKANQGKKFTAVQELCAATCFGRSPLHRPVYDEFDDGHGRLVRRRVFVCPDAPALEPLRDWPGLQTVLAVETIRQVNRSGKIETDIRYFLSSSAEYPGILATAIRRHWPIENGLHWVLDVNAMSYWLRLLGELRNSTARKYQKIRSKISALKQLYFFAA